MQRSLDSIEAIMTPKQASRTKQRILVIGGSGRTGKLVIAEALRRGHSVTALVRTLGSVFDQPGLKIVIGTPINASDLQKAFTATPDTPTIIISTLSQTRKSGNPWAATVSPPRFMAEVAANLIKATQQYHVSKVIIMSMFGAGDSFPNLNIMMRGIMRFSNMNQTLEDHNLVDVAIKESRLVFVLPRPAMLMGEEALPLKIHGNTGCNAGFMPSISMKSVALFILDTIERSDWDGTTPVISN